jgi:hypothetical protein
MHSLPLGPSYSLEYLIEVPLLGSIMALAIQKASGGRLVAGCQMEVAMAAKWDAVQ